MQIITKQILKKVFPNMYLEIPNTSKHFRLVISDMRNNIVYSEIQNIETTGITIKPIFPPRIYNWNAQAVNY